MKQIYAPGVKPRNVPDDTEEIILREYPRVSLIVSHEELRHSANHLMYMIVDNCLQRYSEDFADNMAKAMPKKPRIIEPIPASMEEIVQSFFAKWPEPRDSSKEKKQRKTAKNKRKSN